MSGQPYELIIIGAGTAGLVAADEALLQGATRIALIEKESEPGGDCAHFACVPTKTLLTASKIIKTIREQAPRYGVQVSKPAMDYPALARKVDAVINHGEYTILKNPRITYLQGQARFTGKQEITINRFQDGGNGTEAELVLTGEKIIIATGAEPMVPNIDGFRDVGYMTFRQASRLKTLPKSLLILGGGPVGVEFAQAFQLLGVKVTLINRSELLMNEEPEIRRRLTETLRQDGVDVQTHCEALCLSEDANGKTLRVRWTSPDNPCNAKSENGGSQEKSFTADDVLLAMGLQPDVEALRLEQAGIETTKDGITVDAGMQTSNPAVWAVGDVASPYKFTHVADYQAILAVHNAFKNANRTVDYHALPWAVYTSPAVAHVGLTEEKARQRFNDIQIVEAETEEVSRYRIESETSGFVKLVIDKTRNVLIGGHIFAEQAEEMAHLLLLAIQEETPLPRVRDLMYIYPAKAQLIQKALEKA